MKGGTNKVSDTGYPHVLDVLFQATQRSLFSYKWHDPQVLMGKQEWWKKDDMGILGGYDSTKINGWYGF
jgi:hypothetical protein